jgi:hypothetical protein
LDSSGAVGLKISDVPNGTLETKTSFPNNDLNGVLGTKLGTENKTKKTVSGCRRLSIPLASWGGGGFQT